MGDELKPCPLCGDPMNSQSGMFGHTDSNAECLLARFAWQNDDRYRSKWNTRTETQSQATIDELLGALKACRDRFRRCIIHNGTDLEYADAAVAEYDTLIAKAGGQS